MINVSDFVLDRIDRANGHEDYWFTVNGETAKYLTRQYMEQCMVGVTECVYSADEDIVGVKRQFHFNYDVVLSDNKQLKDVLKELTDDVKKNCDNTNVNE